MELPTHEELFRRYEAQNAALGTLAQQLDREIHGTKSACQRVTELASETLGVARSSVWFFTENLDAIECIDLFERPASKHSAGGRLSSSSYAKYFAALAKGRTIAAHNAVLDPRTAEFARDYLLPLGITSMLDAPIRRSGRLVGVLCNEHIGTDREWTPNEEAFASSLCDILALSLEASEHRQTAHALRAAHHHLEDRVAERTRELAAANAKLNELDRMKSQFLASMSHELRTPLNSILGFTSIIRTGRAGPLTTEQEKQLGMVQTSARHLLSLINDLLDLSRIEAGKMQLHLETIRIGDLTQEIAAQLSPMIETKGLRLLNSIENPDDEIFTDRKKCAQILLNLTANAVKFTDKGHIAIETRSDDDTLHISVSDSGCGIPTEQMPLLFQAFTQIESSAPRTHDGTGLGLYLCKQLLDLLGGKIQASSQFGIGSTFTITLPRRTTTATPA